MKTHRSHIPGLTRNLGLFHVSSTAPRFSVYQNVRFQWFVPVRRLSIVPEFTANGTKRRSRETRVLNELFTSEEAQALAKYLQDCGHTQIEIEQCKRRPKSHRRPASTAHFARCRLEEQFGFPIELQIWGNVLPDPSLRVTRQVFLSSRPNKRTGGRAICQITGEEFCTSDERVWYLADHPDHPDRLVSEAAAALVKADKRILSPDPDVMGMTSYFYSRGKFIPE